MILSDIAVNVAHAMMSNTQGDGLAKAHNTVPCSTHNNFFHAVVISSSGQINHALGRYISSQKNTSEAKSKKRVSSGAKIRLPSGESIDSGKPQATRMGSDIRVRKS